MSEDIVDKLKSSQRWWYTQDPNLSTCTKSVSLAPFEAADEILRLRSILEAVTSSNVEEYVNESISHARGSLEGCPNNVVYGVALRRIIRQAFQAGRTSVTTLNR